MRLKDTKTVKAMIDRIGGGGSVTIATEINASSTNDEAAGAKAVYDFVGGLVPIYPFPQQPANTTQAWIENGETISIDCAALKTFLTSKSVDLTKYITPTSTCFSTQDGYIKIGTNDNEEEIIGIYGYMQDSECFLDVGIAGEYGDPIPAELSTTFDTALTALGTKTFTIENLAEGYLGYFDNIAIKGVTGDEVVIPITGEEAATFVIFS